MDLGFIAILVNTLFSNYTQYSNGNFNSLDALKLTNAARDEGRDAIVPEIINDIECRYNACCEQAITLHKN